MVFEAARGAPYAPLSNVLSVIRRLRERGLPEVLTHQELTRIGVPEGNAPRTLQALRFLNLVDDEGRRTQQFDRLGRASSTEYPTVLGDIIQAAYAPVFTIVDPADTNEMNLHDAFRHYQPQAQRERMVVLFAGLCREAGLMPGGPPERVVRLKRSSEGKIGAPNGKARKPAPQDHGANGAGNADPDERGDYKLLVALIDQLPRTKSWSKQRRDRWVQAMTVNLDLLVEIEDQEE